jgi:hypothetical protein
METDNDILAAAAIISGFISKGDPQPNTTLDNARVATMVVSLARAIGHQRNQRTQRGVPA